MARDPIGSKDPLLVLVNPRAGRGGAARRAQGLAAALRRAGLPFTLQHTTGPGHAEALAAAATGAIVAVGGDGTVHEVVNGLVARDGLLGPLAVLPGGSGDDFAANAGFPRCPVELAARLQSGATRVIDVGTAEIECEHGTLRRRFLNDVGAGFEADVVAAAARTRWLRGQLLYLVATLRALRRQRVVEFDVSYATAAGVVRERLPTLFASACNGRRVGGGLCFAPDARLDDRCLDVLRVTSSSRRATLGLLARLVLRRHAADARVRLQRCASTAIRPASPVPVTMDGELAAQRATSILAAVAAERLVLLGG